MDGLISKIFKSKNKKHVYNVEKSKKLLMKKSSISKNDSIATGYLKTKLKSDFGVYKPKSEFFMTNYNTPCVAKKSSIDDVDVIPQTFHVEQNVDLVKCSNEKRVSLHKTSLNSNLLFANDNLSDIGAESINNEFGIDENEGPTEMALIRVEENIPRCQNREKLIKSFAMNANEDIINDDASEPTNTDSQFYEYKESDDFIQRRYGDVSQKLSLCNDEFIYENKRNGAHQIETIHKDDETLIQGSKLVKESQTLVSYDKNTNFENIDKEEFKKENINDPFQINKNLEYDENENIREISKYVFTKKGRIKTKANDSSKINDIFMPKDCKNKEKEVIARHRTYHSMIIIGGSKKKSKCHHTKNVKITNDKLLEAAQNKKYFERKRHSESNTATFAEDFRPERSPSGTTVRTMYFQKSKQSTLSIKSIPSSEQTLKWLDENFGPGSKNSLITSFDESDDEHERENSGNFKEKRNDNEICLIDENPTESSLTIQTIVKTEDDQSAKVVNEGCDSTSSNKTQAEVQNNIKEVVCNKNVAEMEPLINIKTCSVKDESLLSNSEMQDSFLESGKFPLTSDRIINSQHSLSQNLQAITAHTRDITGNEEKIKSDTTQNETIDKYAKFSNKQKIEDQSNNRSVDKIFYDVSLKRGEEDYKTEEENNISKSNCDIQNSIKDLYDNINVKENENIIKESCGPDYEVKDEFIDSEKKILKENLENTKNHDLNFTDITHENQSTNGREEINHLIYNENDNKSKVTLKLNDETFDDMSDDMEMWKDDIVKKANLQSINKTNSLQKENIKKRQEELEKDYIMTRLELVLNTDNVDGKPEMAKYILERSQEVIKDVVEKTSDSINKKLLENDSTKLLLESDENDDNIETQTLLYEETKKSNVMPTNMSEIIKDKNKSFHNIQNDNETNILDDNHDVITEEIEHDIVSRKADNVKNYENSSISKELGKGLNNISKIDNVKIYRKENKVRVSDECKNKSAEPINIQVESIENIMKNKNMLLEEIKSLRKN